VRGEPSRAMAVDQSALFLYRRCDTPHVKPIKADCGNPQALTVHGLFILQCSNYLVSMGLEVSRQEFAGVPRAKC
jgi:hypothetical protein